MVQFLLSELKSVASPEWLLGMKRFDIVTENAIGVSMPHIRSIAKTFIKNKSTVERHSIAVQLWQTNIHEARILASIIEHPNEVTRQQMDNWTNDFYSWDLCDQVCGNLFQKTDFFIEKAYKYSHSKKEFVKRCGFVLMVQYAVHHKKTPDTLCVEFLQRIEEEACDMRWFVRKAINWCLRAIGKRNHHLNTMAIECAHRLLLQQNESATWIANDALTELKSENVKNRIANK